MNRPGMSRFAAAAGYVSISLAAMCGVAVSKVEAKDGPGGHPLAGRHGGLADLLEAADWPVAPQAMNKPALDAADHEWAPKDASVPEAAEGQVPDRPRLNPEPLVKPAAADPNARRTIEGLITQRNRIIDGCDFFDTITEIGKEEKELVKRLQDNNRAAAVANEAAIALGQVVALGDAGKQMVPAAKNRLQQAQGQLQATIGKVREQQQKLEPMYTKIRENVGPWTETFQKMRGWLVHDRQDPNRAVVLEALEAATAWRKDFYEGHVLAALARAYDGDAVAAERHLTAACAGFREYDLFGAAWGADCCLTYLLLDQPKKVADYLSSVRKLDSKRQTPLLCWLVGQAAMLEVKENEAHTYFNRALTKTGFRDPKQPSMPEPLLGDAAFLYATAKNNTVRDLEKAKELLERAPKESTSWQVLRARAAVLAAEGDSEAARQALDACRERAPGTLDAGLGSPLASASE
jgi:tetratricopeptide (TPR) repeat protein